MHPLKLHAAVSLRGLRGVRGGRWSLAAVAVVVRRRGALRGLPPAEGLTFEWSHEYAGRSLRSPASQHGPCVCQGSSGSMGWWRRRDKARPHSAECVELRVRREKGWG